MTTEPCNNCKCNPDVSSCPYNCPCHNPYFSIDPNYKTYTSTTPHAHTPIISVATESLEELKNEVKQLSEDMAVIKNDIACINRQINMVFEKLNSVFQALI